MFLTFFIPFHWVENFAIFFGSKTPCPHRESKGDLALLIIIPETSIRMSKEINHNKERMAD
jgi:hypothetical protein